MKHLLSLQSFQSAGVVVRNLLIVLFAALALAACGGGGDNGGSSSGASSSSGGSSSGPSSSGGFSSSGSSSGGASSSGGGVPTFGYKNKDCIVHITRVSMACFAVPDTNLTGSYPDVHFTRYTLDTTTGDFHKANDFTRHWHDIDFPNKSAKVDADDGTTTTITWDEKSKLYHAGPNYPSPYVLKRETPLPNGGTHTSMIQLIIENYSSSHAIDDSEFPQFLSKWLYLYTIDENQSPATISVPGTSDKIKVNNGLVSTVYIDWNQQNFHLAGEGLVKISYYSAGLGLVATTEYKNCQINGSRSTDSPEQFHDLCGQHSDEGFMWLRQGVSNSSGSSSGGSSSGASSSGSSSGGSSSGASSSGSSSGGSSSGASSSGSSSGGSSSGASSSGSSSGGSSSGGGMPTGCSAKPGDLTQTQKGLLDAKCGTHSFSMKKKVNGGAAQGSYSGTLTISSDASNWYMRIQVDGQDMVMSSDGASTTTFFDCNGGPAPCIGKNPIGGFMIQLFDSNSDKQIAFKQVKVGNTTMTAVRATVKEDGTLVYGNALQ